MEKGLEHVVYSKSVLEFVTVAAEYVIFAESASESTREDFLLKSQKLLPLLYLQSSLLPEMSTELDEMPEKFVQEEDWMAVQQGVAKNLGKFDLFTEVYEPITQQQEDAISVSLSECFADVFQDLADFIQTYRMGDTGMMNDALWYCKEHFEQYWGPRLLVLLNNIHNIMYADESWKESDDTVGNESNSSDGRSNIGF